MEDLTDLLDSWRRLDSAASAAEAVLRELIGQAVTPTPEQFAEAVRLRQAANEALRRLTGRPA